MSGLPREVESQRQDPHRVELVEPAVVLDNRLFGNQPRQPVVYLDRLYDGYDIERRSRPRRASGIASCSRICQSILRTSAFSVYGGSMSSPP